MRGAKAGKIGADLGLDRGRDARWKPGRARDHAAAEDDLPRREQQAQAGAGLGQRVDHRVPARIVVGDRRASPKRAASAGPEHSPSRQSP